MSRLFSCCFSSAAPFPTWCREGGVGRVVRLLREARQGRDEREEIHPQDECDRRLLCTSLHLELLLRDTLGVPSSAPREFSPRVLLG